MLIRLSQSIWTEKICSLQLISINLRSDFNHCRTVGGPTPPDTRNGRRVTAAFLNRLPQVDESLSIRDMMSLLDKYFRHLDALRRAKPKSKNPKYAQFQFGVMTAYLIVLMSFPQLFIAFTITEPILYIIRISEIPSSDWHWDAIFTSVFFISSFFLVFIYIRWKIKQR